MKRYLFFAELAYAYTVLRPLQREIRRRGDEAAWFLLPECPNLLQPDELLLPTLADAIRYNPVAVFVPGPFVYDFLPGLKVEVFHGYPINKRRRKIDNHFRIRGWFDLYCTQGSTSTPTFMELAQKHRFFRVRETGWCRVDEFFDSSLPPEPKREQPTILYATTFTRGITSAEAMLPVIEQLARKRAWRWILTFHPKFTDEALLSRYRALAAELPNVEFERQNKGLLTFRRADVMLSDSSSIMVEFMMLSKPVVTYRTAVPAPHLVNVTEPEAVEQALDYALSRPPELMARIEAYTRSQEAHTDGHNSARVLDAVDEFLTAGRKGLRHKPLNLFRKLKLRWQLGHFYRLF